MTSINLASYANLSQYGVLAANTITNTGNTIVNNGYWYAPTLVGALTNGTPPSGSNNTLSTNALVELDMLIADVAVVTGGMSSVNIGAGGNDITFSPGISYTGSGITFVAKTITFDANFNSNAQFFITDTGIGMAFTNVTFVLQNGAQACNIFWLSKPTTGSGGFTVTTPTTSVPGIIITTSNGSTSSSTFTVNANNITGHVFSKTSVTFTSTGTVRVNANTCAVVCYAKGTLIFTDKGFVPIENIKNGDKVITKGVIYKNNSVKIDAELSAEPVVWASKFKVVHLNSKSRPICIEKDALGKNVPFRDLYVSPGHSLLLSGKMVLAKNLVNGTTIYQDKECETVEYYHLECYNHCAIYANGVLSESYLDLNNRDVFENSVRLARSKLDLRKLQVTR